MPGWPPPWRRPLPWEQSCGVRLEPRSPMDVLKQLESRLRALVDQRNQLKSELEAERRTATEGS